MPNKLLGQHFLKNGAAVNAAVKALALKGGEAVFEIGPGHGELTQALASACKEKSATLVTIEKDPRLAERLREKFPETEVVTEDALRFFAAPFPGDRIAAGKEYLMVGNIPYYLTGHLLRAVSELERRPARCIFMVQKEVALRAVAEPPKMNRLAASVQFWASPLILLSLSRDDFNPKPEVESSLVLFEAKTTPAITGERYFSAVRMLFAQPRKTILNNLAAHTEKKDAITLALGKLAIKPGDRPQNLTIQNIADIAQALF